MESRQQILVIDDEPAVLRFVSISLRSAGYQVMATTSGKRGLVLARNRKPDLVLLDILMEPMTGFDVLTALRRFSDVPVVVFTVKNKIEALALREGANGVIGKPFMPQQLIRVVEETLAQSGRP